MFYLTSQTLSDTNFDYTKTCSTAKKAYDKSVLIHDKSLTNWFNPLRTNFFHLVWKQSENITSFKNRSHNIFSEANDEMKCYLDCVVPEAILFRIRSMLPQGYIAFKSVWDEILLKDRSIELLTKWLCAFEQQISIAWRDSFTDLVKKANADPKSH